MVRPHIIIIGGGIRGLSCAIHLHHQENNLKITIIDVRAELGIPTLRPGIFRNRQILENQLFSLGITDSQSTPIMIGKGALRREWLVKAMAIKATQTGSIISPRTRLLEARNSEEILIITEGAGPLKEAELRCDLLVIATGLDPDPIDGVVPTTLSLPNDERIMRPRKQLTNQSDWYGAVYSRGSVTGENMGLRSDGTLELWVQGEIDFQDNALERMRCLANQKLPNIEESLAEGHHLSDKVLSRLKEAGLHEGVHHADEV
jgi:hypothetical protein